MANPFPTSNPIEDALAAFNPTGGLKLPNFNPNNNFGGTNTQATSSGSPFQMPSQAAKASATFGGGQFGLGALGNSLNNVSTALNNAANKLSTAADKLIAVATTLGKGGGGVGGTVGTSGARQGVGGGGSGGFSLAPLQQAGNFANYAMDQYYGYQMAGINAQNNIGLFQQGRQGIGSFYRQNELQRSIGQEGRTQGITTGLGFGALAAGGAAIALAPFTGGLSLAAGALGVGAIGYGVGYNYGESSFATQAQRTAFGTTQTQINQMSSGQYAAYKSDIQLSAFNQQLSQTGVTSLSQLLRTKAEFVSDKEKTQYAEAAATIDLNREISQNYASLEKQSIRLTGLRGTAASTGLVKGDQFSVYRTNLGIGTSEAMALESSIIQASGRRGLNGLDASTITGAVQAGYGTSEIGLSSSFLRQGGGLRGLGFGAGTLLRQANAQNLIGGAAQEYMQAAGGFFGGFAQRGVSAFNQQDVGSYNAFINVGRNMGLRSFEGALGFRRAQEISGATTSVAGQVAGRYGNIGRDLLESSQYIQGKTGFEAFKALQTMTPEQMQQSMKQITGGSKELQQLAYMNMGLSPDVIDLMTTKDLSQMTGNERKLVEKGFKGTGAAAGSITETIEKSNQNLIDTLDTVLAKDIIIQENQLKQQLLMNAKLEDIKKLLGKAKETNKALEQTTPQSAPTKDPLNVSTKPSNVNPGKIY